MSTHLVPSEASAGANRTRFSARWLLHLRRLLGTRSQRRLARAALALDAIRARETELSRLGDAELRDVGLRLRRRARGRETLERLLPEAFGAVCVAAWRILRLRPFDVQLAAGVVIHHGAIAELATGEGKTLVASLPAFLNALPGKGTHVATVNDYLARRDALLIGPVHQTLGLTTGVLQANMEDVERAEAYRRDITYGTSAEFGFDFLRDRLKLRGREKTASDFLAPWRSQLGMHHEPTGVVQRGHAFALVDEADNIFIDEARTPLVISTARDEPADPNDQAVFHWADQLARRLEPTRHYFYDEAKQRLELTRAGRSEARWSAPTDCNPSPPLSRLYEHLERALHAHVRFRHDQHYLIHEDKVVIIDESTGRRMPDRQWNEGLHQAVEAKEGVRITQGGDHAARITYQAYFKLYKKLSGMTGTAAENARELRKVFALDVVRVPTNRPIRRELMPTQSFANENVKFRAVAQAIGHMRDKGRPTLIGTRSVERSEILSALLTEAGIAHQVLNARQHEEEADIVARAGQARAVTIATNMAGRGTDIKLGPGVAEAGGLHVILTEMHEAGRIDRQLAGRAGRQGDPGSAQFFLSLDDELLEILGKHAVEGLRRLHASHWLAAFERAQRRTERFHYRQRVDLMQHEKRRAEVLRDLGADPYVD